MLLGCVGARKVTHLAVYQLEVDINSGKRVCEADLLNVSP